MDKEKIQIHVYKKEYYNFPISLLELLKNIHKNYYAGTQYIIEFSFDELSCPIFNNKEEDYYFYNDGKIYTKDIIENYNLDIVTGFYKNKIDWSLYKEFYNNRDSYLLTIKNIFNNELGKINLKIIDFIQSNTSNGYHKFYISLIQDDKNLLKESINNILSDISKCTSFKIKENIIIDSVFNTINNLKGEKIELDKNELEKSVLHLKNYKQGKPIELKYINFFDIKQYTDDLERILIKLYLQGKIKNYLLSDISYEGISNEDIVYHYEIQKNNIEFLITDKRKLEEKYEIFLWKKKTKQTKIETEDIITLIINEDNITFKYNLEECIINKDVVFIEVIYFLLLNNNKLIKHDEIKSYINIDTSSGHLKGGFLEKLKDLIDIKEYDICNTNKGYLIKIR